MSWWRETGEDREGGFEAWRGEVVGKRQESRMMESRHDDTAHGKQADYLHMSIYRFIIIVHAIQ